jgi:hypothetical protein
MVDLSVNGLAVPKPQHALKKRHPVPMLLITQKIAWIPYVNEHSAHARSDVDRIARLFQGRARCGSTSAERGTTWLRYFRPRGDLR